MNRIAVALRRLTMFGLICVSTTGGAKAYAQAPAPLVVKKNLTLEKNATLRQGIVIDADEITIDGNGATLAGPGVAGDLKSFVGVGVRAEKRSRVWLKNLKVRGFETALLASDGVAWRIEGCDFSENYNDPEYGWGEGERNGGMILTRMHRCTIVGNTATKVWNGLDLRDCNDNTIEKNDLSHCGNVCLKMWTSSRNFVRENNLSYGLRIRTGEVHARDSTGVLIESGSNGNRYERNDITHGGDGLFIRVLNGWVSTGNVFIENDCSYANNNAIEAWSPGNTYIRNKANHSSYGFWLGGSDHTVLIGNEAAYNGRPEGFHNAPTREFGNGGIVMAYRAGSHTIVRDNYCHHNNGPGIAMLGADDAKRGEQCTIFHWIIENNRLENNRRAIFARYADWLDLNGNRCAGNESDDVFEHVTNRTERPIAPEGIEPPKAMLSGPVRARVGRKVTFDASRSSDPAGKSLTYVWHFEDKVVTGPAKMEHTYTTPGFYRVGVSVHNLYKSDLAWVDLNVAAAIDEIGTEDDAKRWTWAMGDNADGSGKVTIEASDDAVVGRKSLHLRPDPYKGADVSVTCPIPRDIGKRLVEARTLTFWIKWRNPNFGFQGPTPIVRVQRGGLTHTYTPVYRNGEPRELLGVLGGYLYSEARWGWSYIRMPLDGSAGFKRTETLSGEGATSATADTPIDHVGFQFDSMGYDPFDIWIDGLALE